MKRLVADLSCYQCHRLQTYLESVVHVDVLDVKVVSSEIELVTSG